MTASAGSGDGSERSGAGAPERAAEILFVEDSDDDFDLAAFAFERAQVGAHIHRARDGEEAMQFLRHEAPFESAVRPDLVLLDLNMPRMDGFEVLAAIHGDPALADLPVVVMTSSRAHADMLRSHELDCASYVVKPVNLEGLLEAVRSLEAYWVPLVAGVRRH